MAVSLCIVLVLQSGALPSLFVNVNSVFCGLLLLVAVCDSLFLLFANVVYEGEDNRINSLLGLCFVFAPLIEVLVDAIALVFNSNIDVKSVPETLCRDIFVGFLALALAAALVQAAVVCYLAGTTAEDDTACSGLIERELC